MGGRGTFARGNVVPYSYKTVGFINGVKILEGIGGKHSLPEESHSSMAYIKLSENGTFREMRIYDKDHYLVKEIAYHPEKNLDTSHKPIMHIHEYQRDDFNNRTPRLLSEDEYNQYKNFFNGELRWKPEM